LIDDCYHIRYIIIMERIIKSDAVRFLVTPKQKEEIRKLAADSGTNMTDLIMHRLFDPDWQKYYAKMYRECEDMNAAIESYKRRIEKLAPFVEEWEKKVFERKFSNIVQLFQKEEKTLMTGVTG